MKIENSDDSDVIRAAWLSLLIGVVLLALKFWAYFLTHSVAVLSDALESIVNVSAASFVLVIIKKSWRPPDKSHPYGHGKFEYFASAFEGGLVAFAGLSILVEAVKSFFKPVAMHSLGTGLLIVGIAGLVNYATGKYLIQKGAQRGSEALKASGAHLLSDFWTSFAVILGLFIVALTGLWWLDPLIALFLALVLLKTGAKIIRKAVSGLTDENDMVFITTFREMLLKNWKEGVIQVHHVRAIRSGTFTHVDAHIVVPEFWTVAQSHKFTDYFAEQVASGFPQELEVAFHVDPCRLAYCKVCPTKDCHLRNADFERKVEVTVSSLTRPEEPAEFVARGKPL